MLGNLWLVHLLHLLSASPEAEAERLDWQLCSGLILHCPALVGWSGETFLLMPDIASTTPLLVTVVVRVIA